MRWRRVILFAAIAGAHVLIFLYFPPGRVRREPVEPDIAFAALLPERTERPAMQVEARRRMRAGFSGRGSRPSTVNRQEPTGGPAQALNAETPDAAVATDAPYTDWAREAQIATGDRLAADGELARKANALSAWKSRVMPLVTLPDKPRFRWDYAHTHRMESSPLGLTVNVNDRCSVLISLYLMALIGGCKIGEIPAHGDLFEHMKGDPGPRGMPDR